jgi:hypothetical protein
MLQAARRHVQQVKGDEHISFRHVFQTAPLHQAHGRVYDRFRGKSVSFAVFQAEYVAKQVEGSDLAPTVG